MKSSTIILVFWWLTSFIGFAQQDLAVEVLDKSIKAHNLKSVANETFIINGNGIYKSDSHLENPNQLNEYNITYNLSFSLQEPYYALKTKKKNTINPESISSDSIVYFNHQEYIYHKTKQGFYKTHKNNNTHNIVRGLAVNPLFVLKYIQAHSHEADLSVYQEGEYTYLQVKFLNGELWQLSISNKDLLCHNMSYKYFHYLYGDITEQIDWKDYKDTAFGIFPQEIIHQNKNFEKLRVNQKLNISNQELPKWNPEKVISVSREKRYKDRVISKDSIVIQPIDRGLFEVVLKETNNRLLIAEFSNFLMLLEGSYHSKNGDLVTSVIQEKFPSKPIKYWSFSHCHTQYVGFSRSMVANETTIITTDDNVEFIKKLSSASFQLRPDKQEVYRKTPKFEKLINNKWHYKDDSNEIEIYNIESSHTENYLVFFFPNQKALFVGDLLWVTKEGHKPISGRSAIFYNEVVNRLNLNVETFYISWPLKEYNIKTKIDLKEILLNTY